MKCDEEQFAICKNNSLCHLCDGTRLFKKNDAVLRKEKEAAKRERVRQVGYKRKIKEGMGFEKHVAKKRNEKNDRVSPAARRRPNSGAIWNMPGDIITADDLYECKERGTVTSRGEKTFTIQKSWLDKIKQEAVLAQRSSWAVPFKFKQTEEVYVIKDFEVELDMIAQINQLKERIKELEGRVSNE